MIWIAWRRSRTQTLIALGLLAVFAAVVVTTGLHLHHALKASFIGAGDDRPLANALGPVLVSIPALLGMFWGAPLVARELETGTYRLAWTQSVTRRRWLLILVAVVGVTALAIAGLATWLVTWWYAPLDIARLDRLDPSVFATRGVVAVGYAGFAFALGVASGAMTRRTVPAMVITLAGFAAALAAATFWLPYHLPFAEHALRSVRMGATINLPADLQFASSTSGAIVIPAATSIPNGLLINSALVDRAGNAISNARLHAIVVRACPTLVPSNQVPAGVPKTGRSGTAAATTCTNGLAHHLRDRITYQPSNHYWLLQGFITAIFLIIAIALIGLTLWQLVGRRRYRTKTSRSPEASAKPLVRVGASRR
jgi:hypothetical protein